MRLTKAQADLLRKVAEEEGIGFVCQSSHRKGWNYVSFRTIHALEDLGLITSDEWEDEGPRKGDYTGRYYKERNHELNITAAGLNVYEDLFGFLP